MRHIVILGSVLIAAGLTSSVSSPAAAAPWSAVASQVASLSFVELSFVEKAGWRRNCRRYGCGPDIVAPDVQVDVDVAGSDDVDLSVDADVPTVVVLPPPRPLSCGRYRYWNGRACVDARYNDPYLGPR
jgi:hypothetical protein